MMSSKKQKNTSKTAKEQLKLLFNRFPLLLYLFKWLLICLLIGICIGSASAGFLQSLAWVTQYRENHSWLIAGLPLAGLAVGLLYHYYGKEVAAGNNLLIDTIIAPQKTIPFKLAPFIYIGTMITHLFGGSAGREGTALQMAGAIADQFSKPFQLSLAERKTLMIATIAAGFGSVFGTPLAGAVFALEVFLIGRFTYTAIFPAFAAAIIADQVTRLWNTPHSHFHIDLIPALSLQTIFYSFIAGLAFGLCAAAFSKTLHYISSIFKSKIAFPPLRPFVGGIIVALSVLALGSTKYIGLGIPTIISAFDTALPSYDFALKMAFTILTLAAGFKGGEVTPLFFIGAALGNALSYFIPLPMALLAGMGFVAVFAGATNTPLACTLMALELFGITCAVYVTIACVTAYLFSGNHSIYSHQMIGETKHAHFKRYLSKKLNGL